MDTEEGATDFIAINVSTSEAEKICSMLSSGTSFFVQFENNTMPSELAEYYQHSQPELLSTSMSIYSQSSESDAKMKLTLTRVSSLGDRLIMARSWDESLGGFKFIGISRDEWVKKCNKYD